MRDGLRFWRLGLLPRGFGIELMGLAGYTIERGGCVWDWSTLRENVKT